MQTLTAGSFLNLENGASVEALKFTARRLAEMTATVAAAENLNAAALENLANNLWDKAEYVARETERRRLREIFNENFSERIRELKPESTLVENSVFEILTAVSTIDGKASARQSPAPEFTECGKSECATAENTSFVLPTEADATAAQGKRDEFLGFVKTDETYGTNSIIQTEATTAAPDKIESDATQPANEFVSEAKNSENKPGAAEATNSDNGRAAVEREISPENPNNEKSSPAVATMVAAENNSQAVSANKTDTKATPTESKEPFEFGKCTINLNLVLLPSSGDTDNRKAIVSASSHNLPPEIEFLEIGSGEDLTEIAELVRNKLAQFKQTLPAKYIEQLRASKLKTAKKPAPSKTTTAAESTKPAIEPPNVEKTSDSQFAQHLNATETDKSPQAEITAPKQNAATQSAPVAAVPPQRVAANNVQPSLF